MKKRIIIPLEIELEIDEGELGGKIKAVKVYKKVLSEKEVKKLFKEVND